MGSIEICLRNCSYRKVISDYYFRCALHPVAYGAAPTNSVLHTVAIKRTHEADSAKYVTPLTQSK